MIIEKIRKIVSPQGIGLAIVAVLIVLSVLGIVFRHELKTLISPGGGGINLILAPVRSGASEPYDAWDYFDVDIKVDTGGQGVVLAGAVLKFDPATVEVVGKSEIDASESRFSIGNETMDGASNPVDPNNVLLNWDNAVGEITIVRGQPGSNAASGNGLQLIRVLFRYIGDIGRDQSEQLTIEVDPIRENTQVIINDGVCPADGGPCTGGTNIFQFPGSVTKRVHRPLCDIAGADSNWDYVKDGKLDVRDLASFVSGYKGDITELAGFSSIYRDCW